MDELLFTARVEPLVPFSHLLFHWHKLNLLFQPVMLFLLSVCNSSPLFMLLIQPGISFPLLALYLDLHHCSKTKWNPTTLFKTMVNHAILIILRTFVTFHKYFMAINNILFALWMLLSYSTPWFRILEGKGHFSYYLWFPFPSPQHLGQY